MIGPGTAGLLARSWAAPIGASGTGSPVYQGGVRYAGGSGGLYGLDPGTGATINFPVGPVTTTLAVFPGLGRVPGEIDVGSADENLAAASRAGRLLGACTGAEQARQVHAGAFAARCPA